jgi:hypothetical protein
MCTPAMKKEKAAANASSTLQFTSFLCLPVKENRSS